MADVECRACKETKDSTFDFYWSGGERQRRCKTCMKAYTTEWHRMASQRIAEAKQKRANLLASPTPKKDDC